MARTRGGPKPQSRSEFLARMAAMEALARKGIAGPAPRSRARLHNLPADVLEEIAARAPAPRNQAAMRATSRNFRAAVDARRGQDIRRATDVAGVVQSTRYRYYGHEEDDEQVGNPWMTASELVPWLARRLEELVLDPRFSYATFTFRMDPPAKVGTYTTHFMRFEMAVDHLPHTRRSPTRVTMRAHVLKNERTEHPPFRERPSYKSFRQHGYGVVSVTTFPDRTYTLVGVYQRHPRASLELLLIIAAAFRSLGRRRPELGLRPLAKVKNKPWPAQKEVAPLLRTVFDQVELERDL